MNILIINGSPKGERSNTMRLTRAFLDGVGRADADILDLSKMRIKPCAGCFSCWNKTPGRCVIDDDMADILHKLVAADLVVWSFPLYYFSVPGGLKNLIDRQLPLNLPFMSAESESGAHPPRFDLSRQRHVVLSTCGFWTSAGNYDGVVAMFDHFCGADKYTAILCGQGELFRVPELRGRTDAYLEIVRRAGAEFAAGGIRAETRAELAAPLYPRAVFEKMADASWGVAAANGEAPAPAQEESLRFTRQMAALYRPDGAERVLEFCYTDIGKTYQLLLTARGAELIADDFRPYTTRIETPYALWRSIARGELSGSEALFRRAYRVLGDFEIMLRWDALFGAEPPQDAAPHAAAQRKTNMAVLLAPWVVIWIGIAIDAVAGGAAGAMAAALTPLLWLAYRPVFFEQISLPVVAALSVAAMLGADARLVVPLSYGLFGLMWLAGAFARTPLTAHYSAGAYGGARAFDNPLFMLTNRILTAAWAALYLVTPIWTYFLMGTRLSPYTGLINSACPILMGLFTLWFQRWYPARRARGRR
jgi:putative NADPH-quinone reductase